MHAGRASPVSGEQHISYCNILVINILVMATVHAGRASPVSISEGASRYQCLGMAACMLMAYNSYGPVPALTHVFRRHISCGNILVMATY